MEERHGLVSNRTGGKATGDVGDNSKDEGTTECKETLSKDERGAGTEWDEGVTGERE